MDAAQIPRAITKTSTRKTRPPSGRSAHLPGLNDSPYTHDETEFMLAMDQYKRDNRRPYPTWHEVLLVLISLGYRKVEAKQDLPKVSGRSTPKETA